MHAAFLTGRTMQVKIGNKLSARKEVTGGAVQGSILGVMDHNAVLEDIDSNIPDSSMMQKYVDDATLLEAIDKSQEKISGPDGEDWARAESAEAGLAEIQKQCAEKKLKVNEEKTKILAITGPRQPLQVWLKTPEGKIIESGEKLRLLGFDFSPKPDCSAQVKNILRRASHRFYILRHYSKFMRGEELITLYSALFRSVLEYSSAIFGPMLTKYQSNEIERFQKRCLKCMFGYDKSYRELLEISGLPTLEERRNNAIVKFARKTAKNENYRHLFPLNESTKNLRNTKLYKEEFARTERLYKSPLFKFRRIMNDTPDEEFHRDNINDLDHLFNNPFD